VYLTISRAQLKSCLRAILNSDVGVSANTELIWKFRSIDRPLPCTMKPVNAREWLHQKIGVEITQEERKLLTSALEMSDELDALDVLEHLGG
jgi:hypothetical protein